MAEADEFPWDYSYFKWQDIPREVRRQMVLDRSLEGRTWMCGAATILWRQLDAARGSKPQNKAISQPTLAPQPTPTPIPTPETLA